MTWPFDHLRMFGYGAIIADPPWHYEMYSERGWAKAPMGHYATLPDEEILSLPIEQLAQRDCLLWLWATWPRLDFALSVMKRWQFSYVTGGAWVKRTKNGKLRWGTGYCMRSVCEPFLIGRMGEPQIRIKNLVNLVEAEAREHSRKPDEARAIVERMTPHAYRVELFAREAWPGNEVWGNETEKFEAAE
jgi:N6-adenosine-specific RNA methylase IME4